MAEKRTSVTDIPKNATNVVRVQLTEHMGNRLVDVRVHYSAGEEWKPSRAGVSLRQESLPELIEALQHLQRHMDAELGGALTEPA